MSTVEEALTALFILFAVVFIIGLIVAVVLIYKAIKRKRLPDDSDSSDSDEIIDDWTGAFTHYLCNTHKLQDESVFVPKDEKLVIY